MTTDTATCTGPNCPREVTNKTLRLCNGHDTQIKRGRPLAPLQRQGISTACTGPECGRPTTSPTGLCRTHREQRIRAGELSPIQPSKNTPRRHINGLPVVAKIGDPCMFDGCDRTTQSPSTGLCRAHVLQRRAGKPLRKLRVAGPSTKRNDGLPRDWFKPSIKAKSNPAGVQKLSPDAISAPLKLSDQDIANAMLTTVSKASSKDEARMFLDMLFDIKPNQKAA